MAAAVVGAVEAGQHRLKILVTVEGDAQHLALHPPVEALHHTVGAGRVGLRLAVLHAVLLAGVLEGVSRETGTAVGQHMRDPKRQGRERLLEEGHS